MEKIDFDNLYFSDLTEITINKYFKFIKGSRKSHNYIILLHDNLNDIIVDSCIPIFIYAMKLTFPEIHIYPKSDDEKGIVTSMRKYIIDYYVNEKDLTDIVDYSKIEFTEEKSQLLRLIFTILCRRNQKANTDTKQGNEQYKFAPWQVAYNYYLNACSASSIDGGVLYLVSGLEALLTNKEEGLSQKTSLRASVILSDNEDNRKNTFNFIKQMYDIRSLVVHGDPDKLLKLKYKWFFEDSYSSYFRLKKILSEILIKLDIMTDKNVIIDQIQKNIFDAQFRCEPINIS